MDISKIFEAYFLPLQNVLHILLILMLLAVGTTLTFILVWCTYNVFFHQLSKYPGPVLAGATGSVKHFHMLRGQDVQWAHRLHQRYGPVVRIAPNVLSFIDGNAARDIWGHKAGKAVKANYKPPRLLSAYDTGELPLVAVISDEVHGRTRKIFSHAFSDAALRKQDPMFQKYAELLIASLRSQISKDPQRQVDLVDHFNFTSFDIMGDLTFAEPLGMLQNSKYNPWVKLTFMWVKAWSFFHVAGSYPPLGFILKSLIPASFEKQVKDHQHFSEERVERRLEKPIDQPDIWGLILKQEGDKALNRREMYENSKLFMIAGTETTATAMSGIMYYLMMDREAMQKLRSELKEAFPDPKCIGPEKLQGLRFLTACIDEGLRIYPPVPLGLPRITPAEGNMIGGEYIPGNVELLYTQYAAYRSEYNYALPDEFHPERWLDKDDVRFRNDSTIALLPFSYGPRNCLGKNMAYYEMRLVLAKLILNFDLELCPQCQDWPDQKIFNLWEKKPLLCRLTLLTR